MTAQRPLLFTGITRRRGTGYLLIWVAVGILFWAIYETTRRAIVNEVRAQAMGVAIATAAGIAAADLAAIRGPEDVDTDAFRRVQGLLDRISTANPDIRYIYTMRRATREGASTSDYLYIVDQPARDENRNNVIDPDEIFESPGNTYDASELPEMVAAWQAPSADYEITPDPPYPDLISGYAPVKNERGITVAIVGVDIIAATVRHKLFGIQAINVLGCLVLAFLTTIVFQLYYQQREALEQNRLLAEELASRNEMLRAANVDLAEHNRRIEENSERVTNRQHGPSHRERLTFDQFHLTCDILGGDLFDVFCDNDDHVVLYLANVAGHGVSAALISGLLKMAVSSVRDRAAIARGHLHADLMQPDDVLATLNEMLVKELPDHEFATLVYGVLDLSSDVLVMASAGHPPPVHFRAASGDASVCPVPHGAGLGLKQAQTYALAEMRIAEGDKLLFYTGGLAKAMNERDEVFGEERIRELVRQHGHAEPATIITALREAVDGHRGSRALSKDFSLLVAEHKRED